MCMKAQWIPSLKTPSSCCPQSAKPVPQHHAPQQAEHNVGHF